ncbi:MAG TPA: hypothetical protein VMJ52_09360 [Xanthobacteraceae bacterium]|nr:hypothetical protein [Xanthobacteraceae bacterium]
MLRVPLSIEYASNEHADHEGAEDARQRMIGDALLRVVDECRYFIGEGVKLLGKIGGA